MALPDYCLVVELPVRVPALFRRKVLSPTPGVANPEIKITVAPLSNATIRAIPRQGCHAFTGWRWKTYPSPLLVKLLIYPCRSHHG